MIDNDKYGLKDIQNELLQLFRAFDIFCRANEINYSLHGGTLLGAVREEGFIPWDDDIDLLMTKENYLRLAEKLQDDNDFYIDKDDTWVPRFRKKNTNLGVFLDIFILTEAPVGLKHWFVIAELKVLQGLLKKYKTEKKISAGYRALMVIAKFIGGFFQREKLLKLYWKIGYEHEYHSDYIFQPNTIFAYLPFLFSKEELPDSYTELNFEGQRAMAFDNYKCILIKQYGTDYMTPPPEKERKPIHQAQIK